MYFFFFELQTFLLVIFKVLTRRCAFSSNRSHDDVPRGPKPTFIFSCNYKTHLWPEVTCHVTGHQEQGVRQVSALRNLLAKVMLPNQSQEGHEVQTQTYMTTLHVPSQLASLRQANKLLLTNSLLLALESYLNFALNKLRTLQDAFKHNRRG